MFTFFLHRFFTILPPRLHARALLSGQIRETEDYQAIIANAHGNGARGNGGGNEQANPNQKQYDAIYNSVYSSEVKAGTPAGEANTLAQDAADKSRYAQNVVSSGAAMYAQPGALPKGTAVIPDQPRIGPPPEVPQQATTRRAVGERKTANGAEWEWDGKQWVEVL